MIGKNIAHYLLCVACILLGIVNMQQDHKIEDLTKRISTLEQTK